MPASIIYEVYKKNLENKFNTEKRLSELNELTMTLFNATENLIKAEKSHKELKEKMSLKI